jgi:hypothetical protein
MLTPHKKIACENYLVQCQGVAEMSKALDRVYGVKSPGWAAAWTKHLEEREKRENTVVEVIESRLPDYETLAKTLRDLLNEQDAYDVWVTTGLPTKRCQEIVQVGKELFDNGQ